MDEIFPTPALVNAVSATSEMSSIGMEAANPEHVIVSAHAPCNPPAAAILPCRDQRRRLELAHITVPAPAGAGSGDWTNYMPGAGAFILSATTWLFGTYSDGLWLTEDDGATFTNVAPTGATGSTAGKTLNQPFVSTPEGYYYLPSMDGILKSADGKTWTLIPSSGGQMESMTMGDGNLYASDQWKLSYETASETNDATWTPITAPAAPMYETFPQGGIDLADDQAHHILYSSNWYGGVWRMVTP